MNFGDGRKVNDWNLENASSISQRVPLMKKEWVLHTWNTLSIAEKGKA